ncbi:MAG: hypothetical protein OIN66_16860 [Candidatus Methanoperedens sp.]|nr:hypothetical protein [Candidatus Methanoperedens sp.]
MKLEHKVELIIGLAFLVAGIFLNQSAAVGLGIVATLSGIYRYIKYTDLPEHDERTKKLSGVAFGYTLLIVLFSVIILMLIDKFKILDLTVPLVLSLIFLVLILSLSIFLWYFGRRSDVE